jgi:hypothetical protein
MLRKASAVEDTWDIGTAMKSNIGRNKVTYAPLAWTVFSNAFVSDVGSSLAVTYGFYAVGFNKFKVLVPSLKVNGIAFS